MDFGSGVLSKTLPNLSAWSRGSSSTIDANTPVGGRGTMAHVPTTANTASKFSSQGPSQSLSGGYTSNCQWTSSTPSGGGGGARTQPTTAHTTTAATDNAKPVEERVADHLQQILIRNLRDIDEETRRTTDEFLESQIDRMHEHDRQAWLQELLGYHSWGEQSGSGAATDLPALTDGNKRGALSYSSTASNSINTSAWSQTQVLALGSGKREGFLDPEFERAHWRVVYNMTSPLKTAEALKDLVVERMAQNRHPDTALSGYSTAWDLTLTILRTGKISSPVERASATLIHLCQQFENVVRRRVQEGIASGAVAQASNFSQRGAQDCQLYVQLQFGPGDSNRVWQIVYYCLRIGDAKAAYEVWNTMSDGRLSDSHRTAISNILGEMSKANVHCLWEAGIPFLPSPERRALEEMINRQDRMLDIHCCGILNLLTGQEDLPRDENETTPGFSNVEDYLFGRLWKAQFAANPVEALCHFGQEMQTYASHFQDEASGGWSYALPLLASQQYARACTHLAESGEDVLLQATHLGLVLATAGVEIANLGDTSPDPHILASIVDAYAKTITGKDSSGYLAALEYLVRIPEKVLACKAVAKLIVATNKIKEIAGEFNQDGLRQGPTPLDKHFAHYQMQLVLTEAADLCLRNPNDHKKIDYAVACYMLAGRYDSVVDLLNRTLSPPNYPDENRVYWIAQVRGFRELYINKRTAVYRQLEKDKKLGLVDAMCMLLDLNEFFENLNKSNYEEALVIVKKLDMVPSTQTELNYTVRNYRERFDDSIRGCYPDVLLGTMKALYFEHSRGKSNAGPVVSQRLKELQAQASYLVTFAGLIEAPADQIKELSKLQALMI
eukprot:scaffold2093_cov161-Amphora_coffeaeformis.AAC.12